MYATSVFHAVEALIWIRDYMYAGSLPIFIARNYFGGCMICPCPRALVSSDFLHLFITE